MNTCILPILKSVRLSPKADGTFIMESFYHRSDRLWPFPANKKWPLLNCIDGLKHLDLTRLFLIVFWSYCPFFTCEILASSLFLREDLAALLQDNACKFQLSFSSPVEGFSARPVMKFGSSGL